MTVWYKEVPDDQKFSYSITPKPGSLLRAKLLGGQLQALAELMTSLGDTIAHESPLHFETFLADISMDEDGTVRFDLAVLPREEDDEESTP